jgi:hypothetical protein
MQQHVYLRRHVRVLAQVLITEEETDVAVDITMSADAYGSKVAEAAA